MLGIKFDTKKYHFQTACDSFIGHSADQRLPIRAKGKESKNVGVLLSDVRLSILMLNNNP